MGEITISLCFCRTRTVGFRAGVKVQTVFLAWSTEGVTDAEVKRCMQLKWRSLAFVIQSEESPSGINMHSDARLESRLHKGLFALGSYLCLCGFVAETWMCGAQRSSVVETQAHSMHGSCSSVWTNSSSKQSHFLVFFCLVSAVTEMFSGPHFLQSQMKPRGSADGTGGELCFSCWTGGQSVVTEEHHRACQPVRLKTYALVRSCWECLWKEQKHSFTVGSFRCCTLQFTAATEKPQSSRFILALSFGSVHISSI